MTPDQPQAKPRSRKIYVLWSIALTLLLALGLLCWLVVVPVWQVREGVTILSDTSATVHVATAQECIDRLGGPGAAADKLKLCIRLPDFLTPDKSTLLILLGYCARSPRGEEGQLRVPQWSSVPGKAPSRQMTDVPGVAAAYGRIVPGERHLSAGDTVAFLRDLLTVRDQWVRCNAACALVWIEPKEESALSALEDMRESEDVLVRQAAAAALKKIKAAESGKDPK